MRTVARLENSRLNDGTYPISSSSRSSSSVLDRALETEWLSTFASGDPECVLASDEAFLMNRVRAMVVVG